MSLSIPLTSKHADGVLRVAQCSRISTLRQDMESTTAQLEESEKFLRREYCGRLEIRTIADQGSGWLAERPGMNQVREWIDEGWCDLVLVNELREVFRNPAFLWRFVFQCLDRQTRFISVNDSIDTAQPDWENLMHVAVLRHGMSVPETRRRVRGKATHSFSTGGMVTKVQFGYRKLTAAEGNSGEFGTVGLRIAKIGEATQTSITMAEMVVAGRSYEAVADWLEEEGVDPGPYVTSKKWTGRLVRDFLKATILSGQRQFRKSISQIVYETGKHRAIPNAEPESKVYPELAHLPPELHAKLRQVMLERKQRYQSLHPSGRRSPCFGVPRSRSLWPGQHPRCAICGGLFYRFGTVMKCQNARGKGPKGGCRRK